MKHNLLGCRVKCHTCTCTSPPPKPRGAWGRGTPRVMGWRCVTFQTMWVASVENFQEQWNIWKASPVFPDGKFLTEVHVAFLQSHLWYQFQDFEAISLWMELICTNGKCDSWAKFNSPEFCLPKPWTDRFAYANGKQPENIMKIKGIPKALASEQFCDGMTHICFVCWWFFREFKVTLSI